MGSSDQRFSVQTSKTATDSPISIWNLQISQASKEDNGWYECQINTEPKMGQKSYLKVQSSQPKVQPSELRSDAPMKPQVIPEIQQFLERSKQRKNPKIEEGVSE